MDVQGRRVTLVGLGRHGGGVGAARFLSRRGARLTVTDKAPAAALADSIAAINGCRVDRWRFDGHDERDFLSADLLVVNPAVPPEDPLLALAQRAGIPMTSEIELFLSCCPARIAGVTGSNGKSSTAAMLASILRAAGHRVWLGGNIGRSLLDDLPSIAPGDDIVLELSSFQLARLGPHARGVDLAVVTQCTSNHLDWHGSFDEYRRAKQRLLWMQPPGGLAVLNLHDAEVWRWSAETRGRVLPPWGDSQIPPLGIPGRHQRVNARLAAAAAAAWGAGRDAVEQGLRSFAGLPHRLEWIREVGGRAFYNDSLSTTPESTIAGLESFDAPVWLLAGGYDKGVAFHELADAIVARAAGVACYGAVGDRLQSAVAARDPRFASVRLGTLRDAVDWCWRQSQHGDVLLLSPACASYDQFRDYGDRAACFQQYVAAVAHEVAG